MIVFGLNCVFLTLVIVVLSGCSSLFSRHCGIVRTWVSHNECGFIPNSISFDYFSFSYFSLLVFFVVFDLEVLLLLNMPEQNTSLFVFYYYVGFLVVLPVGFLVEAVLSYVRWGN